MASSGLLENVILTKINNYHRYIIGYVKRGTWCQDVTLFLQHQQLLGMGWWNTTNLVPYILAPGTSLHITHGAIYGKY